MELNYQKLGSGHPLIILHGLYGSGGNWLTIGKTLSGISEVYLVDQRNHGASPHSAIMDYRSMATDLEELMDRLSISKAALLGHSMGGKAAMWFATEHPGRVSRLIVADISPRSYADDIGPSNHAEQHKLILTALHGVDLSVSASIGDVDHQLASRLPDKRLRQFLLKNLNKTTSGQYEWKINIESISRNIRELTVGLDMEALNGKSFSQFPVLFIKGEKSPYIQTQDLAIIRSLFPLAQVTTIKNAGHWLHAEEPDIFTATVKKFLLG